MSVTRSVEFYCGKKNVRTRAFFGGYFMNYEFCEDIAYKNVDFSETLVKMREYMEGHNIKIGYVDISTDFGGGYSLIKRYTIVNKKGNFITKKQKYDW